MKTILNVTRRDFLKSAGGLVLAVSLPQSLAQSGPGRTVLAGERPAAFAPNAFIRISTDNTVTVVVKHLEMGQGTYTGLPTLVAEELDADWAQIRAVGAPADARLYNNLFWGQAQGTGGSTAMPNSYEQTRKAGDARRRGSREVESAGC
jgi:isoquinoline 1-oxidoreductase beta subunit